MIVLHGVDAGDSSAPVPGLDPADISSAYGLSGGVSSGVVGIVIAYHHPALEADLAVYRRQFGLPPCTVAGGCLTVVSQRGGTDLPGSDPGWGAEESLDVQAVSAACPACRILVVETDSPSIASLGTGVNTAVQKGAQAVSASWTVPESSGAATISSRYFTHPGVPVLAATGDAGYGTANMPAALPNVIAVGGTTLTRGATASAAARARDDIDAPLQITNGDTSPAVTASDLDHDTAALRRLQTDLADAQARVVSLTAERDTARRDAAALSLRLPAAGRATADSAVASARADATARSADRVAASARGAVRTRARALHHAQAAIKAPMRRVTAAKATRTRLVAARARARRPAAGLAEAVGVARGAVERSVRRLRVARAEVASARRGLASARRTAAVFAARSTATHRAAAAASARLAAARAVEADLRTRVSAARSSAESLQRALVEQQARTGTLADQVATTRGLVEADQQALQGASGSDSQPVMPTEPVRAPSAAPPAAPAPPVEAAPTPPPVLSAAPVAPSEPTAVPTVAPAPTAVPEPTTAPVPTARPAPPAPTAAPAPPADPLPSSTPVGSPSPADRGWTETAWSGAGSGCSTRTRKPSWQKDPLCAGRVVADLSADADPATGLAVYDSYGYGGWIVAGGTSLATPLVAGMLVRSGRAAAYSDASGLYTGTGRFTDVTAGSNGSCGGTALCAGAPGYDGPTGLGTPKSLASF